MNRKNNKAARSFFRKFLDNIAVPVALSALLATGAHAVEMHEVTPKMQTEMDQLFSLVNPAFATNTAIADGNWSDSTIWANGTVPEEGARVLIPADRAVTIDGVLLDPFMTVRVDGTLRFATDVDTQLRVDTLITSSGSTFEMGTMENPIAQGVTAKVIIDDQNGGFEVEDTASPDYDPVKLGQGIIAHGRFVMQGAEKTGYGTIDGASMGDTVLTLDEVPNDWEVGDRIVIAASSISIGKAGIGIDVSGDEVRTIAVIDTATNTVELNEALANDHHTPPHHKEGLVLKVHVANTTRNARIETAEGKREPTGVYTYVHRKKTVNANIYEGRGHVMFMHHNDVQIRYGEFLHMGRSNRAKQAHNTVMDELGNITQIGLNPIARYPVHFHRSGVLGDTPALVHGSSVFDSPGWGYVNHGGYVMITNNIAYDIGDRSFVTERSDERGAFIGNLSINSKTGVWTQGPLVFLRNNIVSGARNIAYEQQHKAIDGLKLKSALKRYNKFPERLPLNQLERKTQPSSLPFNEHTGNMAYASGQGITLNGYHPGRSYHHYGEIVDFTAWNVGKGATRGYASMVRLTNPTFINDFATPGDYGTANIAMIDNPHIEGFLVGVAARAIGTAGDITTAGIFGKYPGRATEGGYLNNLVNILVDGKRGGLLTTFRNITFGQMSPEHVAIGEAVVRAFGNHTIARHKFGRVVMEADATSLADLHNVDVSRQQNFLIVVRISEPAVKTLKTTLGGLLGADRFTTEIDGFVYELMAKREQHADYVPLPSWLYPAEKFDLGDREQYRDLTNAEMFALSQQEERILDPSLNRDIAFPDRGASVGSYFIPADWRSNPDYLDGDDYGHGNVVLKKMRDQNGDAINVDWEAANAGVIPQPDFVEFVPRTHYQPNLTHRPIGTLIANDDDSDWRVLNPFNQGIIPQRHWKYGAPYKSVLSVVNMDQPRIGILGPGTQSYSLEVPDGFSGIVPFRYHVADITGKDAWETAYMFVRMDVDPSLVNYVPEAEDDEYTVVRGETTVLDVLANDIDPEGGQLVLLKIGHPMRNTNVGMPNVGTAEIVDNQIHYTADPFFTGTDRFVYYAIDNAGNMTRRGTVTVHAVKPSGGPVNNAPEAVADSATTDENKSVTVDVLANDTDADGDALTVTSGFNGSNGSIGINLDGTITYTPNAEFFGSDSFSYTISDGNGGEATATVAVTVNFVNSVPVAVVDSVTTDENSSVTVDVLANDTDADGDTLTVTSGLNGSNGSIAINLDGTIVYTPNAEFFGSDSFSYTISDGNGGEATANVSVTVNEVIEEDVSDNDLVVHYTFDDGTAADSSPYGSNNSGTLQNGASVINGLLTLDGVNDIVAIGNSADINMSTTSQRTISLRFMASDVSGRKALYEEGGGVRGMNIYIDNGSLYVGGWNTREAGWTGTFLSTAITAGEWHSVTLTLNGTDTVQDGALRGYLDGGLFGEGAGSQVWKHGGDVRLGGVGKHTRFHDGKSRGASPFAGQVDDFRIYNRTLSAGEVGQLPGQ